MNKVAAVSTPNSTAGTAPQAPAYADPNLSPEDRANHQFFGCLGNIRTGVLIMSGVFICYGIGNLIANVAPGPPTTDITKRVIPLIDLPQSCFVIIVNILGFVGGVYRNRSMLTIHGIFMGINVLWSGYALWPLTFLIRLFPLLTFLIGYVVILAIFTALGMYGCFLSMKFAVALKPPILMVVQPGQVFYVQRPGQPQYAQQQGPPPQNLYPQAETTKGAPV